VATFTADPSAQAEIERVLNLADEVIRHKVLVLPAKRTTMASAAEQRSATSTEAEASPAPA
jgi:ribosomal protein S6